MTGDDVTPGAAGGDGRSVAVMLTPPGTAAIAVLRLCGPLNASFAKQHLTRPPRLGVCVYCDVQDGDDVIDDAVVVLTPRGDLDLNVHGGPWVTQSVLRMAERAGYVVVGWREDAGMALEAVDDVERQVLLDLPTAQSPTILRLLLAQPPAWRTMLAQRDMPAMRVALADTALERALAVPTVAIVGRPNVGKSTLANALFGQERSITADRPGTTRDWVGELANIDGLVVRLIDTPGGRETGDAIEAAAIAAAGREVAGADLIVIAIDGSRPADPAAVMPFSADDGRGREWLAGQPFAAADVPTLIVRTKADLPTRCMMSGDTLAVSAVSGGGLDLLRAAMRERLGVGNLKNALARCWTATQRYKLSSLLNRADASI